jgi:membrane fusion protein, heavy metal efflux system
LIKKLTLYFGIWGPLLLNTCYAKEEKDHQEFVELSEEQAKLVDVRSQRAELGNLDINLPLVGEIFYDKNELYHVSPQITGIIDEITVNLGDSVEKNGKLVKILSRELANIKANYLAAKSSMSLANANLAREQKLLKQNISPRKDYLIAKNEVEKSKIKFELQKNKLVSLGLNEKEINSIKEQKLNQYWIKGYGKGTVIKKHAAKGEFVDISTKIFTIANLDKVWVIADVYEKDIEGIKVNQKAVIKTKAYKDKTFTGHIAWISDIVDDKLRTLKIRIEVDNKDRLLKPGMLANVSLNVSKKNQKSLLVPFESLVTKGRENYVFVNDGQRKYIRKPVKIGDRSAKYVEIVSGINPKDLVVTKGRFILNSEIDKNSLGDAH